MNTTGKITLIIFLFIVTIIMASCGTATNHNYKNPAEPQKSLSIDKFTKHLETKHSKLIH